MTLYHAWTHGHRWVLYHGLLCRVSLPPAYGIGSLGKYNIDTFWVTHLGHWRKRQSRFHANVPMSDHCIPVQPNTPLFKRLYRGE